MTRIVILCMLAAALVAMGPAQGAAQEAARTVGAERAVGAAMEAVIGVVAITFKEEVITLIIALS